MSSCTFMSKTCRNMLHWFFYFFYQQKRNKWKIKCVLTADSQKSLCTSLQTPTHFLLRLVLIIIMNRHKWKNHVVWPRYTCITYKQICNKYILSFSQLNWRGAFWDVFQHYLTSYVCWMCFLHYAEQFMLFKIHFF